MIVLKHFESLQRQKNIGYLNFIYIEYKVGLFVYIGTKDFSF